MSLRWLPLAVAMTGLLPTVGAAQARPAAATRPAPQAPRSPLTALFVARPAAAVGRADWQVDSVAIRRIPPDVHRAIQELAPTWVPLGDSVTMRPDPAARGEYVTSSTEAVVDFDGDGRHEAILLGYQTREARSVTDTNTFWAYPSARDTTVIATYPHAPLVAVGLRTTPDGRILAQVLGRTPALNVDDMAGPRLGLVPLDARGTMMRLQQPGFPRGARPGITLDADGCRGPGWVWTVRAGAWVRRPSTCTGE